jgi:defect-in-organelle-trafficking protein DotC
VLGFFLLCLPSVVVAAVANPKGAAMPADLSTVLSGKPSRLNEASISIPRIRYDALQESYLKYGTQSGFARRTYEIRQLLDRNQNTLDGIYNFNALMLASSVLPAVLVESVGNLQMPDANTIRIADVTYHIESQVRFVTAAPSWRDYLYGEYASRVGMPDAILLPKNDDEQTLWRQYVTDGWLLGQQQADQVFRQSLMRLQRDFKGMILYRELVAKKMITVPYVAEARLGVTGDANNMNINDRIVRITDKPKLDGNPMVWKPLLAPGIVKSKEAP